MKNDRPKQACAAVWEGARATGVQTRWVTDTPRKNSRLAWLWRWALCVAALGMMATGGAGCVSQPVVALSGVQVRGASTQGVTLNMVLSVHNDNAFDVKVRNVRATVTINDRYVLPHVRYDPNVWLGAGKDTRVPFPVVIPWSSLRPILASSVHQRDLSYHVTGLVDVTAVRALGIRSNDYPVERDGTILRTKLTTVAGLR